MTETYHAQFSCHVQHTQWALLGPSNAQLPLLAPQQHTKDSKLKAFQLL